MRVIFAGTPEFAVPALAALHAAGHAILRVLSQPDRPAGRGLAVATSPVKRAAQRLGIPVLQPQTLQDPSVQAELRAAAPDVMVVAAYGLILPPAVLAVPRHGAINIHASLLPRWRGAAPIQRAILAGDALTGVCIMQMEAGLDTGPVLLRAETPIGPDDTAGSVHDRLAALGAPLVVETLASLERGTAVAIPQAPDGATYAPKVKKAETRIDWTRAASEIDRQIRAFNPFPGAFTGLREVELKVWGARLAGGAGAPGTILAVRPGGIAVACGEGALELTELQRAGGKRLGAEAFLRGFPIAPGERFEAGKGLNSGPRPRSKGHS